MDMVHVLLDKCKVVLKILNAACLIHPPFNLDKDVTIFLQSNSTWFHLFHWCLGVLSLASQHELAWKTNP